MAFGNRNAMSLPLLSTAMKAPSLGILCGKSGHFVATLSLLLL